MNYPRIVGGGLAGGVAFVVVSLVINMTVLAGRYKLLQEQEYLRPEPRIPFFEGFWSLLLLLAGVALVWLYAAVRPRLGPGPKTALMVGVAVGLLAGVPGNMGQFAWAYVGGFVSMWWTVEMVAGCALATLVGAWLYKE